MTPCHFQAPYPFLSLPVVPWRQTQHALSVALFACTWAPAAAEDLTTLPLEQLLTMEVYSAPKYAQKKGRSAGARHGDHGS